MTPMPPPYLPAAMKRLAALNTFASDRALRRFQLSLFENGSFAFLCPFTGRTVLPDAHYLMPGAGVQYRFGGPQPFILTAGSLKDGFPLLAIVTRETVHWACDGGPRDLVDHAQSLLQGPPPMPVDPTRAPQVHLGNPNFAHVIWNEFPALLELLRYKSRARFRIAFDPLGILQRACDNSGKRCSRVSNRAAFRGWSDAPVLMPGSTFCSADAMTHAHHLLALPPRMYPKGPPRIWITMRDRGRTMENQEEFLRNVIRRFHTRDPETEFLLDGFSCPEDLAMPLYDPMRKGFAARIAGAKSISARLEQALPEAHIIDMTGRPIGKALTEIASCSFYVSHAGTMQHKAAWFYPLQGFMHGNTASLSPAALRWTAQMTEGAIPPVGLWPEGVQDTAVRGAFARNERNRDYIVTDIADAASRVLAAFDAAQVRAATPMPVAV